MSYLLVLVLMVADGQRPKIPIPDSGRWVQPGDEAEVIVPDAMTFREYFKLGEYADAVKANDRVGIENAIKGTGSGMGGVRLTRGTKVLVIKSYVAPPSGDVTSPESFAREVQSAVFQPKRFEPIEVRVLDGDAKDTKVFVLNDAIARMKDAPAPPAPPKPKPPPKAVPPAERAATLLKAAQNLEKAGKVKSALENYRRVVAEFQDTPAAKDAAARIKVLVP